MKSLRATHNKTVKKISLNNDYGTHENHSITWQTILTFSSALLVFHFEAHIKDDVPAGQNLICKDLSNLFELT